MRELVTDWIAFQDRPEAFDSSHFYTLLIPDPAPLTPQEQDAVFGAFPQHGEALRKRYLTYLEDRARVYENTAGDDVPVAAIIELAQADLSVRREVCAAQSDDELCGIIDRAMPRVADRDEVKAIQRADGPHQWLGELIGDAAGKGVDYDNALVVALRESCYGLTTNLDLQNYLTEPLLTTTLSFQTYYDFWRTGARYALSPTELLIALPG
jgi:hypothetical protein